jgi:hypothetical protein
MTTLNWTHYTDTHVSATVDNRVWHAGPRRSDGCWEFYPPDDDAQGITECWTKQECLDKAHEYLEGNAQRPSPAADMTLNA